MTASDEFFNQQVDTGPILPGEYQTEESKTMQPTTRKLTMSYSRTVQVTQYEPATVSATMEADLPENCTVEQAMEIYENEMMLVKAAVLSQQNLPFELSDNERMIQEVFGATQPVSQFNTAPPAQLPPPTVQPQEAGGFAPPPAAAAQPGAVRRTKNPGGDDLAYWDMLVANPGAFWDNRSGKTNPQAPDFKLKVDRNATPEEKKAAKALWLNACPDQHMAHFGVVA